MCADYLRELGGGMQDELVFADLAQYHTSAGLHMSRCNARLSGIILVNTSAIKLVLSFKLDWILIFIGPLFLR